MKRTFKTTFLLTEALLYIAFLSMDHMTDVETKWIKFASILLIAAFSFLAKRHLLNAALCLTAAADVFLLLLDHWYGIGIFLFILVQLLYSLHLRSRKLIYLQITLLLIAAALLYPYGITEALAVGYISIFLVNLIHAGVCAHQSKASSNLLFFFGLFLFFCCDLCVGYYNIGSGALRAFAGAAMWAFYLPGQVLILLSDPGIRGAET